MVRLVDQHRAGLQDGVTGVDLGERIVRATIPVVEALVAAGAGVLPVVGRPAVWSVRLGATMPGGIVACHINEDPWIALRLECEPPYEDGHPDTWQQVEWLPCPKCGAPVVWYEAGYVPGYRVCSQSPFHHSRAT